MATIPAPGGAQGTQGPALTAASRTLGSDPGLTPNLPRPSVIIPHMHPPVNRRLVAAAVVVLVLCTAPAAAQLPANMQDILRRIHTTQEFGAAGRGAGAGGRWVDGGAGYAAVERTPDGAAELVRYDTATGRRDVLMTAAQLTPPALGKPLQVADYAVSADGRRMLFATSGRPTMIRKTAHDYWTLDKIERRVAQTRRRHRGRLALREVVARRVARGLRPRQQPVRGGPAHRRDHRAHERRVADDHQRHLRLGLRGGARPARRLRVEPRRPAHRLLPVRPDRRAGVRAHQLHRRALSVHHQVPVSEGGPDQCVGAHRRGGGGRRAHPVDERSPAIRATPTSPAWTGR